MSIILFLFSEFPYFRTFGERVWVLCWVFGRVLWVLEYCWNPVGKEISLPKLYPWVCHVSLSFGSGICENGVIWQANLILKPITILHLSILAELLIFSNLLLSRPRWWILRIWYRSQVQELIVLWIPLQTLSEWWKLNHTTDFTQFRRVV